MRIDCPTCSAAYEIPDSLVPSGRVVRCARCGSEWAPVAADRAPTPEAPAEPPPTAPLPAANVVAPLVVASARQSAMDRLAADPAPTGPSVWLRLAWAGSVAALLLLAGAAYTWRHDVIAVWPASARAYTAFGLKPQTETPR